MSVRVSPTEKIRAEIDALFGGERELGEVIEDGYSVNFGPDSVKSEAPTVAAALAVSANVHGWAR